MKPRRLARIVCLQALYAMDTSSHDVRQAFAERVAEEPLPPSASEFAQALLDNIARHLTTLDDVIGRIAPEWPTDQMGIIDRNVLRIGVCEVLFGGDTPLKVAINEAIELAKTFGGDNSPRFVNGALGALADRFNEFSQQVKAQNRPI